MRQDQRRLLGIDLFRGLAAFSVIVVHVDGSENSWPNNWEVMHEFCQFAVPFFIFVSFYMTIKKIIYDKKNFYLKPKLNRLIVPYIFWSMVYLAVNLKSILEGQQELMPSKDIVSIVFFGGAAVHLYFLPILILGLLIIKCLEKWFKKTRRLLVISIIFAFFLLAYQGLISTNNSFILGPNIAFESFCKTYFECQDQPFFVRFVLVLCAWSIRCFSYIFSAFLFLHPSLKDKIDWMGRKYQNIYIIVFGISFFLINLFGKFYLLDSIYEIMRGCFSYFFALGVSKKIKENKIIKNLGDSSYGIYLLHMLVVTILAALNNKLNLNLFDTFNFGFLLVAVICFSLSWAIVSYLRYQKLFPRFIFG